jgi:hypothetical protein
MTAYGQFGVVQTEISILAGERSFVSPYALLTLFPISGWTQKYPQVTLCYDCSDRGRFGLAEVVVPATKLLL